MNKKHRKNIYLKHFVSLFKSLKKRKLFGSFMLSYDSIDSFFSKHSVEAILRHDYRIQTDHIRFTTGSKNNEFNNGLKIITSLESHKSARKPRKEILYEIFLEDYFKEHPETILSKHTDIFYRLMYGIGITLISTVIYFFFLSIIFPIPILLFLVTLLSLYVSYAEYKVCN